MTVLNPKYPRLSSGDTITNVCNKFHNYLCWGKYIFNQKVQSFKMQQIKYLKYFHPSITISSAILKVNAHAEVNILNLNYINSFLFYSATDRLSDDTHNN